MSQLSNDLKWNKIKAIEKELSIIYDYYNYFYSGSSFELSNKIAKREVWLLANNIYNIATSNCDCRKYIKSYVTSPITWQQHVEELLDQLEWRRGCFSWNDTEGYDLIEEAREDYEYMNG